MAYKPKGGYKAKRGKAKYYRIKDVGRPKHHYLRVAVFEPKGRGKGKRGGTTTARLVTIRQLQRALKKAQQKRRK